jgi:DeoR family transcriptional regulator of aga operon
MSSKTDKRATEILRLLLRGGKTSVNDLTDALSASPASIRRDLARLEERGLVHRVHGGALLSSGSIYEPFRFDASFHVREDRFALEKERIAHAAVGAGARHGWSLRRHNHHAAGETASAST